MRSLRTIPALLLSIAALCGASAAFAAEPAPDDGGVDEARQHFKAGVAYLQDPEGERYEEAYAEFKKAYELSKSPKVLGNVALCAMMLERDGEAIDAYTRYLREVPDIEPEEREQNTRDLETLTAGATRLKVAVEARAKAGSATYAVYDTRVPVRGSQIVNVYGPFTASADLVIRPGRHVISVKVGERESAKWEMNAPPGSRLSHDFRIEDVQTRTESQPREASSPSRVGPIVLMSVGGAALVAGGIFGVVSLKKTHSLEDRCPNDVCPPSAFGDVDSTRTLVRTTDFLLLGGGVLTAAGIGWLIFSPPSGAPRSRGQTAVPTFVAGANVGAGGYGGTLRMRF